MARTARKICGKGPSLAEGSAATILESPVDDWLLPEHGRTRLSRSETRGGQARLVRPRLDELAGTAAATCSQHRQTRTFRNRACKTEHGGLAAGTECIQCSMERTGHGGIACGSAAPSLSCARRRKLYRRKQVPRHRCRFRGSARERVSRPWHVSKGTQARICVAWLAGGHRFAVRRRQLALRRLREGSRLHAAHGL